MDNISFSLWVWLGSLLAGLLGSLTGMGGGIVIVPMLTLVFGVDIHYAIGASLISVISTSSGAASAYVKEGFSNIRIGMFLEIATTAGAIVGAYLAGIAPSNIIAIVFAVILFYSAITNVISRSSKNAKIKNDPLATRLRMNGNYPAKSGGWKEYNVRRVPQGFGLMFIAGNLSGLLGIGSGAAKVLAMDQVMKIPYKVSTTTSNFMIGVTAAASAGIYLSNGFVDPALVMPVMLGVLAGAFTGAKILHVASTKWLRILFSVIVLAMAIEMIVNVINGNI
jgi:uncharacterized membrane protein YfcA